MNRAILLDRDGTLIPSKEDRPISDLKDFHLLEGVVGGLRPCHQDGYGLFVVSNQAGISDGRWTKESCDMINNAIKKELDKYCIPIREFFICPHRKDAGCDCRKPKPGMIYQARDKYNLNLAESYMIGNELKDVAAGREAGCTTILIGDSYKNRRQFDVMPHFQAKTIEEAVKRGYIPKIWRPDGKIKTC